MDEPVVKELIVTGPQRERLYDLFSRVYAGRRDVRVVMDRRRAPELHLVTETGAQGRRRERRQRPPVWIFPPAD